MRQKNEAEIKYGKLKSWFTNENDLLLNNLSSRKICEDELKKEPSDAQIESENTKASLKVFDLEKNMLYRFFVITYRIAAIIFCVLFCFVMVMTVSNMPATGDPSTPANDSVVSSRYIEKGLEETGAVNIVGGMILDYRAFDTLGESHVLFIATMTVLILMRRDKDKEKAKENDRIYEPKNDDILQVVTFILMPIIIIFGIYVVLNGHISPGGGFSGGAIIGAGLILYLNAFGFEKTEKFFTEKLYKNVCFAALAFYALAKCYSFFCGANHLDSHISTGIPGRIISAGLILPLNIAVGCVVACTMYAFYAHFRKGGF